MVERTDEQHAEKMKKKQAAHDKIMATKTQEKGLLICLLYTSPSPRDS